MSENSMHSNEDFNISHSTTDTSSAPDLFQQIGNCLQLQNSSNKEDIITDVLIHGRQSLIKYKTVLTPDVLSNATTYEELLNLLKRNVIETWETILLNQPKIKRFYDEVKTTNPDVFNKMVERVAETGNRHKENSSQILFLVLQLSFPYIAHTPELLDELWCSLATDGIKSLRNSSQYIAPDDLSVHLNYEQDETPLYSALRVYYKVKAAELFQKHNIFDNNNLYNLAADAFTRTGWISGIETIRLKIAPFLYEPLLQSISNEINTRSSTNNTIGWDIHSKTSLSSVQPSYSSPILESISQRISNYLQLDGYDNKNEIISSLLKSGRKTLFQYKEYIVLEVFTVENNWTKEQKNETPLLKLLREYKFGELQILLEQSQPVLFSLIKEQKDSRNSHQFRNVEIRFAQYGTIYTRSSFILSFVLQLLFDGITDDCMLEGNIFTNLFKCITDKGIHGAEEQEYTKYIAPDDLREQIDEDQSMLHLVLRMYFYEKIEQLFSQHGICDKNQRYDLLADKITKDGWLTGIESIKDKISQVQYNAVHKIISNRLRYLSITEATPTNAKPIRNLACDQSNFATPNFTVTPLPQLQLDCEPNDMLDEMKYTLDLAIVNRHSDSDNQSAWPKEQALNQFEIEWTKKVVQFEELSDRTKLLNDSIEYVHQKHNTQETLVKEKISIPMISDSTELDSETLAQQWKNAVCVEAVRLGDKCVTSTERNARSIHLDSSTVVKKCIYINRQQLIESLLHLSDEYNEENTRATTTSEQVILVPVDQKSGIITKMMREMTDNIFGSSNILLLNNFVEVMYAEIMILISKLNSVGETTDELLENISRVMNQTVASVNDELAPFDLKLSPSLMATIDSNTLLLLTIFRYQKRKEDISQQYVDFDKHKSAFLNYFLELLMIDRE